MKLLKEAEYMAATGFTLTPANRFALGAGSVATSGPPTAPVAVCELSRRCVGRGSNAAGYGCSCVVSPR
jgi:hypothetical protein